MDIHQVVDKVFDLNYLGAEEFPKSSYKKVCILGGGTAGYLCALALRKTHPYLEIELLESSKLPVIGVGESTTTEILAFLHHFLEIDPVEFFKKVEPTFKLGIQFDWGKKDAPAFNFNFFAGHLFENFHYNNHTGAFNWPSDLMNKNKIPVVDEPGVGLHSFLNSIPFAYHLDNKKLIKFLSQEVQNAGVKIIDAKIKSASLNDQGEVDHLVCDKANKYSADFFVDCTGFYSFLLDKTLKDEFISFESTLYCDRAITFSIPNKSEPSPFTGAITMDAGWCWKIPMRDEDHMGYVHSSRYLSEDKAKEEIKSKFGKIKDFKTIGFRSGRHQHAIKSNVFALGNSYAFIEPLESTAIQTLVQSLMIFCRLFPKSAKDTSSRKAINAEIAENWDSFRAFLGIHYKYNEQKDTSFWKDLRANIELGRAKSIVDLYHQKAPLAYTAFGGQSPYVACVDLVFNSYSYDSLLMGQGLAPKLSPDPRFSKGELDDRLASYDKLSGLALSQKELFSDEERFFEQVLIPLFETHDSWVRETLV